MTPTPPLTKRQRQVFDFICAYQQENDISPTLEEIAQHFGVNKVTVFGHVGELKRKGLLADTPRGISRGLQPVEPEAQSGGLSLPILGRIAAGSPIEAIEDKETLDFAELVPKGREVYALRVRGDSMIEDAIREDDIVLVEKRDSAHNGETVVAVLDDGEATLKRFYREKDRIRLQPANSTMSPIYADSVEIRGVVVGVVRKY